MACNFNFTYNLHFCFRSANYSFLAQGIGDPPPDSSLTKPVPGRHPTGGSIRLISVDSPAPKAGASEPLLKDMKRAKKPRTEHASAPHSIGGGGAALPDRLCERMMAADWNERYEAISTLEKFVNSRPGALSAHLVKVHVQQGGEGGGTLVAM